MVPWQAGDAYSAAKITEFSNPHQRSIHRARYLLGFNIRDRETVLDGHRVQVGYEISEGEPSQVGEIAITGNTAPRRR